MTMETNFDSFPPDTDLEFSSHNESCTETIILIHGAAATGLDWDLVEPYLSTYHLVIPSLFTKKSLLSARQVQLPLTNLTSCTNHPQWQARYVELLARLIQKRAKGGKAHVVGLSLGGSFALALVTSHPKLALSLFVSGVPRPIPRPSAPLRVLATIGLFCLQNLLDLLGPKMMGRFLDNEVEIHGGSWDGKGGRTSYEQAGILVDTVAGGYSEPVPRTDYLSNSRTVLHGDEVNRTWRMRVVAATRKSKWTPIADDTEWAVEAARKFVGLDADNQTSHAGQGMTGTGLDIEVFDAKRMFHPWLRQIPELFANCILATIEGHNFPSSDFKQIWKL